LVDADSGLPFASTGCSSESCEFSSTFLVSDLTKYTVVANTEYETDAEGERFQSVKLCRGYDYDEYCRCENSAPYSLFGDTALGYTGRPFEVGSWVIYGTPFFEKGCVDGSEGDITTRLTIHVIDDPVDGTPAPIMNPPPIPSPVNAVPTMKPNVNLFAHCEQPIDSLPYQLTIQELQSPAGPLHSDGILSLSAGDGDGQNVGLVWFSNDIVEPVEGQLKGDVAMGTQTGHCVMVEKDSLMACYFHFNVQTADKMGRITAEALFDLTNFPNANLVITGGTGDFTGIKGAGCTTTVPGFDFEGTTFLYTITYDIY